MVNLVDMSSPGKNAAAADGANSNGSPTPNSVASPTATSPERLKQQKLSNLPIKVVYVPAKNFSLEVDA